MLRPGYLQFTLSAGERLVHVPARLDHLAGNARSVNQLDGGDIDRVIDHFGGGGRCLTVYHARSSLGHPGERHTRYNDVEEAFGMSRTYQVQIAEPEHTRDVVLALRDLSLVESSTAQTLAITQEELQPPGTDAASLRMLATEPHRRIHADQALAMEPGDERITVAIVDTGIVVGHPEFQRKCLAGYNAVDIGIGRLNEHMRLVGDSRGRDYNPYDYVGHGCHVGGIIGAQGWRVPRGVAGRALLLPIRVLAAAIVDGNRRRRIGVGALPDIDLGLKVACDLGADVVNMSFGTAGSGVDPDAPKPHAQVIVYLNHYGCVLVAAAGNSGIEEDYFPARLPSVICVGSVSREGRRSRFSTWGRHVALCAPGENIVSVAPSGGYQVNSGTSFAAPFVSAIAALMLGRANHLGKELGAANVRRLLIESASPLATTGFNAETGHGLVDAHAALVAVDRYLGSTR